MATRKETEGGKPRPDASRLKIEGDWKETVKRALGKKRPPEGWPRPPGKRKRAEEGREVGAAA